MDLVGFAKGELGRGVLRGVPPEPFSVSLMEGEEEEEGSRAEEGEAGMLRRGRLEVEEEARSPRAVV